MEGSRQKAGCLCTISCLNLAIRLKSLTKLELFHVRKYAIMSVYPFVVAGSEAVFLGMKWNGLVVTGAICLILETRKDHLNHCGSITTMHLSTFSFYHFVQNGEWKHITTTLDHPILGNVEKGWFSLAGDCVRGWPF